MPGPFPQDPDGREGGAQKFCDALNGREDFILVLHNVRIPSSFDLGTLVMWPGGAGVSYGGGPFISTVTDDEPIRDIFRVCDSPIKVYPTEVKVLSLEKSVGCLGLVVDSAVAVIALAPHA